MNFDMYKMMTSDEVAASGMALLHKPICKGFFSDIIFK